MKDQTPPLLIWRDRCKWLAYSVAADTVSARTHHVLWLRKLSGCFPAFIVLGNLAWVS